MITKNNKLLLKSAKVRIIGIGFIFGLIFVFFSGYLTYKYMGNTKKQRLDHLKQTVQIARNSIEPILAEYRAQNITMEEALEQVRNLVRRMVYNDHTGQNYIFMSAYDGIMLVQPFEPQKEMTDMWDLKDSNGFYIIRALVKTAKSGEGQGFVSYYYLKPGQTGPHEKISYVIGIPELGCYIGTGQYMTDLRKNQTVYILQIIGLSSALMILLFVLIRASMKEIRRQNMMLQRENESLKLAEKALQNSEKNYKELLEQSPIGLALSRMDGTLVTVNSAYAESMGYSIDEVLTFNWSDITPEKYIPNDREQKELLKITGKYGPYEKELIHKDGHPVPVRLNGMVVTRESEKFIWSSVEDITQLKKAEKEKAELTQKLQQSYKMEAIGTLAGGIAHDFNNILFPILGHTEMLLESVDDEDPNRQNLVQIYNSSLRAKDLVKQILTFSRQEKFGLKTLKIQSILTEALRLIRSTVPTNIEIVQKIQNDCRPINADPTQLHQVIMNLATNAYHAMENTGGVMIVSLEEIEIKNNGRIPTDLEPGHYARLTFTDQGIGMDHTLVQKIFDPFFTTKEQGKGTGMGLSVVHGIVKKMKGVMKVKSEPGNGSEFNIYFPIADTPTAESGSEDRNG